jgi:hypothetical protein
MIESKRYNPSYNGSPVVDMVVCTEGEYVLYSEIERITKLAGGMETALAHAKSKIKDMQILFKEAADLEGLTVFVCGDKYSANEIDYALKAWRERGKERMILKRN